MFLILMVTAEIVLGVVIGVMHEQVRITRSVGRLNCLSLSSAVRDAVVADASWFSSSVIFSPDRTLLCHINSDLVSYIAPVAAETICR